MADDASSADPDVYDDDAGIEAGRLLFAQASTFILGAAALSQLPDAALPEIAFAGRSNVGKSSLVNALTGRQALARTSNTPGRTQQLNLFDLGGRLCLVDLPGYGYARAPKPLVEAWTRLVFDYLRGRPNLRRVLVLIDARHGLKAIDSEVLDLLGQAAVPFQLVLTKADLVPKHDLVDLQAELTQAIARKPGALPEVMATSSRKGLGIERFRASLATLALR